MDLGDPFQKKKILVALGLGLVAKRAWLSEVQLSFSLGVRPSNLLAVMAHQDALSPKCMLFNLNILVKCEHPSPS